MLLKFLASSERCSNLPFANNFLHVNFHFHQSLKNVDVSHNLVNLRFKKSCCHFLPLGKVNIARLNWSYDELMSYILLHYSVTPIHATSRTTLAINSHTRECRLQVPQGQDKEGTQVGKAPSQRGNR